MKKIYFFLLVCSVSLLIGQVTFTEINDGLPDIFDSSTSWGDYDNDGDLDILMLGKTDSVSITEIYRNDSGVFNPINAGLIPLRNGSAEWGDYDNDGNIDILITGYSDILSSAVSKIYRNNGDGSFSDINAGIENVYGGCAAWGDYDNDGDLDILITGNTGTMTGISKIYRNDSGLFTDINAGLTGVYYSSGDWGDYDNDGDLDILLTGYSASGGMSKIYRNDSGAFTDVNAELFGFSSSSAVWGDYDNDGDLDLLITGLAEYIGEISIIYRNDSGMFSDMFAGMDGVSSGSAAWGDYDNDGDLDILLTGYSFSDRITKIYSNDWGSFTDISAGLPGVDYGSAAWGDYDNDGDLDFLLTGDTGSEYVSKIFQSDSPLSNIKPDPPSNLISQISALSIILSWDKATDMQTPQDGLSYNIYIGSEPLSGNNKNPMSNIQTGYRKVVNLGNINQNNSYTINNLPLGEYYWSVQAVDHTFAGSEFAQEQSFILNIEPPFAPVANEATDVDVYSFTANWEAASDTKGYYLDVATDISFTNYVTGYQNKDVANVTSFNVTGLSSFTNYHYRVRAYNTGGTGDNSNTVLVETLYTQFLPTATNLINAYFGSAVWGDYDNDGDLDILLTGSSSTGSISKIYRNDSGIFTDINAGLSGVYYSSAAWGDYDNDGDLDILLTGFSGSLRISKIYRNDSGIFTDINAGLTGVIYSAVAWGDYDNDGDLDILLTGYSSPGSVSKIYRNDSGVFTDISAGLPGVSSSTADWGDYDNDGDLDILITGNKGITSLSDIYRNDSGVFTGINSGFPKVYDGAVDWGDYDNDGDLDIVFTGDTRYQNVSIIYRNDSGTFTDINAGLTEIDNSSAAWGDYDCDGDLDLLCTGYTGSAGSATIYRNDSGIFTDINAGLIGVQYSSAAWGDYDNDGDLDILITGDTGSGYLSQIYKNISTIPNTIPSSPSNLNTAVTDSTVTLTWNKATDNETPQNGLSYNLYIRSDSLYVKSSMSNDSTGYRKIVNMGNVNKRSSWTINNLPGGIYYWSVQAVDNGYAGSEFAPENSFYMGNIGIPANINISETSGDVTITWDAVSNATSYKIYACSDPYGTYSNISSQGTFTGTSWSHPAGETKLFYYVVAVN